MENKKLNDAVVAFKKKYPMVTSADLQTFILGWQANDDAKIKPSEDEILDTIIDCVFIRGIELELYRRNFTNEQSGLYDALIKLFNK
jgi:hypothetical protein